MKYLLAFYAITIAFAATAQRAGHPVISQVYGGGGNIGAQYTNDFIELFNPTDSAISLVGWSVQYASAAGTGGWVVIPLTGAIQPGRFYLVQMYNGGANGSPLPTPDAVGNTNMSATDGKVALCNTLVALNGACPDEMVDLIGYGSANCFEGVAAAVLSNTQAAIRWDVCSDSNNNAADFIKAAPNPRNSNNIQFPDCFTTIHENLPNGLKINISSEAIQLNKIVSHIRVIDLSGRCIISLQNMREIEISHLHPGIYFLEITEPGRVVKFLKP